MRLLSHLFWWSTGHSCSLSSHLPFPDIIRWFISLMWFRWRKSANSAVLYCIQKNKRKIKEASSAHSNSLSNFKILFEALHLQWSCKNDKCGDMQHQQHLHYVSWLHPPQRHGFVYQPWQMTIISSLDFHFSFPHFNLQGIPGSSPHYLLSILQ